MKKVLSAMPLFLAITGSIMAGFGTTTLDILTGGWLILVSAFWFLLLGTREN